MNSEGTCLLILHLSVLSVANDVLTECSETIGPVVRVGGRKEVWGVMQPLKNVGTQGLYSGGMGEVWGGRLSPFPAWGLRKILKYDVQIRAWIMRSIKSSVLADDCLYSGEIYPKKFSSYLCKSHR